MGTHELTIDRLQNLFAELDSILEVNRSQDIDHHITLVKNALKILSRCRNEGYADSEGVIEEIKSIHHDLYPARGGLSDFFIWKEDFNERVQANEALTRVCDEIRRILNAEKLELSGYSIEKGRFSITPYTIGIYPKGGKWYVYKTDERGEVRLEKQFLCEDEGNEYLERLIELDKRLKKL